MRTTPIDPRQAQVNDALFRQRVHTFVSQSIIPRSESRSLSVTPREADAQVPPVGLQVSECAGALSSSKREASESHVARLSPPDEMVLSNLVETLELVQDNDPETRARGHYNRGVLLARCKLEVISQRLAFKAAADERPSNALYRASLAKSSMTTEKDVCADWKSFEACLYHNMFNPLTRDISNGDAAANVFVDIAYVLKTRVKPDEQVSRLRICEYAERACLNAYSLKPNSMNQRSLESARKDLKEAVKARNETSDSAPVLESSALTPRRSQATRVF